MADTTSRPNVTYTVRLFGVLSRGVDKIDLEYTTMKDAGQAFLVVLRALCLDSYIPVEGITDVLELAERCGKEKRVLKSVHLNGGKTQK